MLQTGSTEGKPLHIVQALAALSIGGSELVSVELAEYARAQGHRVTVLADDGPLGERVRSCGAQLLDWPIGRKRISTLACISKLRNWLQRQRPDIVHVHSRLPAWICHHAIRKLPEQQRPVLITSMHGHYSVNRYSAIMTRGDRVIAVSNHVREYTLGHYPQLDPAKLVTVHGGVSLDVFPHGHRPGQAWLAQTCQQFPELEGKRLLCLPGRLTRYKGHSGFLDLVARVRSSHDEVHGLIVGKARPGSHYRRQLEAKASKLGISDHITFAGARTDMRDWLALSEIVFSLCSDPPEAFGRTVPEALHLGTPVIGWDHGGVSEVLAGMFPQGAVTPGNHESLLQKTLAFLDAPLQVAASSAFGLEQSMAATMAVYRDALRASQGGRSPVYLRSR